MTLMGKIRYRSGKTVHPYMPWKDDEPNADQHFRGFKATQNGQEWLLYSLPCLWLFVLYSPAIPAVGGYLPWLGGALGVGWSRANVTYVAGYIESADGRLKGFRIRTMILRAMFGGAIAGMGCAAARAAGIL